MRYGEGRGRATKSLPKQTDIVIGLSRCNVLRLQQRLGRDPPPATPNSVANHRQMDSDRQPEDDSERNLECLVPEQTTTEIRPPKANSWSVISKMCELFRIALGGLTIYRKAE